MIWFTLWRIFSLFWKEELYIPFYSKNRSRHTLDSGASAGCLRVGGWIRPQGLTAVFCTGMMDSVKLPTTCKRLLKSLLKQFPFLSQSDYNDLTCIFINKSTARHFFHMEFAWMFAPFPFSRVSMRFRWCREHYGAYWGMLTEGAASTSQAKNFIRIVTWHLAEWIPDP